MRDRGPKTLIVNASEARKNWSAILDRVFHREVRVIVEKRGVPVAAIVPLEDLGRLAEPLLQVEQRVEAIDTVRAAFQDVPDAELETQVERAAQAARIPPGPHS